MNENIKEYWDGFLKATGRPADTEYYGCFAFGTGKQMADELLALVLSGQKRATTSTVPSYEAEGERLPRVGDLSVVLDGDGAPRCVIETMAITAMPFGDMTYDICKREGEDDTLASWRAGHIKFFSADAVALGYQFNEETPVIFEDFTVVYQ